MSDKKVINFRNCDLDSELEITELMKRFYSDVAQDDLLGHVFNDVAHVDWNEHLVKIKDFWCRMLLGIGDYRANPLESHVKIHQLENFTHDEFRRWLELFQAHVDAGWEGPYAQEIKRKAVKVALVHSRLLIGEPLDVLLTIDEKKPDVK